ncbi:uncharacterized protein RCO7_14354 [Rhynchosporium graminicola]|uniref:Uncharacterized protein n=1 Tax=Rhynchosporium graminicola TaxID=2792576 RepID=A0A1E1KEH9_9HELO|nr:uncharacterized protein RCO7_14354 [Rhynchosporium commune]
MPALVGPGDCTAMFRHCFMRCCTPTSASMVAVVAAVRYITSILELRDHADCSFPYGGADFANFWCGNRYDEAQRLEVRAFGIHAADSCRASGSLGFM